MLQARLKSCQGMNLFKHLEERAKHPVFQENMQAANTRVSHRPTTSSIPPQWCHSFPCPPLKATSPPSTTLHLSTIQLLDYWKIYCSWCHSKA